MEAINKGKLWKSLEQKELPDNRLVYSLSGMLQEDIERFTPLWHALPATIRKQLVTRLRDISEADFAVDFSAVFFIALDSADAETCVAAIEGLVECEDIRLISRFSRLLKDNPHAIVRAAAAEALACFVLSGELGKIQESKFIKIVTDLVNTFSNTTEDIEVRRRALESVAYTGSDDVPELIQEAYLNPNEKIKASAVFAMGRSADKHWSDIVLRELVNTSPEMRYEATRACGELQIKKSVPELIELTEDADVQIQEMALWSLGQIGGSRARRTLEAFLQSENEALSEAAQQAIDELDFFQDDLSSFLGPPSEFDGESEERWLSKTGLMIHSDDDAIDDEDIQSDENEIDFYLPEEKL